MKDIVPLKVNKVLESVISMNDSELEKVHLIEIGERTVLSTSDLTMLFQVTDKTIYMWRRACLLKFTKFAGKCYYVWKDILPLLETRLFQI